MMRYSVTVELSEDIEAGSVKEAEEKFLLKKKKLLWILRLLQ